MSPELESHIRELLACGAPLKNEEGKALLDTLDEMTRVMLNGSLNTAEAMVAMRAARERIKDLEHQVEWLKGNIAAGSP